MTGDQALIVDTLNSKADLGHLNTMNMYAMYVQKWAAGTSLQHSPKRISTKSFETSPNKREIAFNHASSGPRHGSGQLVDALLNVWVNRPRS